MNRLSEKELSALNDTLAEESLLIKKYKMLAQQTDDIEIMNKFEEISRRHQRHYNELFELLN